MRNVPTYVEIKITLENIESISKVIKNINNKLNPYIINLLTLPSEMHKKCLENVISFIELKLSDFQYPYPIYFISKEPLEDNHYLKKLCFSNPLDIPNFYFRKEKRTTRIHANMSRLNISAEKNLELFKRQDSQFLLKKYSEKNKKLYPLIKENSELKKFLDELGDYE